MLNFEEGPGNSFSILSMIFQEKNFILTHQISLSDRLYFLRYWAIRVLQLFVSQVVTSYILTLTLYF